MSIQTYKNNCRYINIIRILSACKNKDNIPFVIAIDGRAAAGKTTLAEMLSDILLADVIHMDDFFLPLGLRNEKRFQTPGGNVHYERFFDEVVCNLKTSTNFSYTKFDCSLMDYNGHIDISVGKFIIVEGSYSHHPYFKKYADLTVFLDVDKKEQGKRILERNGEVLYKKFKEIWIPLEEEYFFEYNIKNSADIYLI